MTSSGSEIRKRQSAGGGLPSDDFRRQISDRNFLQPQGFKLSISRSPKVAYFGTAVNIPGIELGVVNQTTPGLKNIPRPGEVIEFEDLTLRFMVDENLVNYMKIHNWMSGLGYPDSTKEFKDLTTDPNTGGRALDQQFSDGSLHILNSTFRDVAIVKFRDLFPVYLTSLEFEASDTDIQYFTAEVTFKYTIYDIVGPDGRTPL